MLHLLESKVTTYGWNFSTWKIYLFPPFIYSVIYFYPCVNSYLFYTLGYNPLLFICSNCLSFGHCEFIQLAPVSLWDTLIILCIISTFFLSGTMRWSRLILYISCPSPRISHFSRHPRFLLLKHDIKNQDLGIKYACCYWNVISSWQSKKKNVCI